MYAISHERPFVPSVEGIGQAGGCQVTGLTVVSLFRPNIWSPPGLLRHTVVAYRQRAKSVL